MEVVMDLLITTLSMVFLLTRADVSPCPSTQYLRKGSTGHINCAFTEGFFAVLWYNSTDIPNNEAVIVLQQSVKSGIGYESGEYNIYPNGSLIIENVTGQHDGTFTVLKWQKELSVPDRFSTTVIVVANSLSTSPVIEQCKQTQKMCILDWEKHSEVTCFVEDAPFEVSLRWLVKTVGGDRNISYGVSVKNETSRITSRVTTRKPFTYSSSVAMLTCKAYSPPGLLQENESYVLLLDEAKDSTLITPIETYLELGSTFSLKCPKMLHVVWQVKKPSEDTFDLILYATHSPTENLFVNYYDDEYELDSEWSLIARHVSVEHGGLYRCIRSNGIKDDVRQYNVTVFVSPTPNYPVIGGCNHDKYCVMEVQNGDSITCTVHGIRPPIMLDLKTLEEEPSIRFYDRKLSTTDNEEAYDISLTVKCRVDYQPEKQITAECRAAEGYGERFNSSTKFDISILNDETARTAKPFYPMDGIKTDENAFITILFVVVLFITDVIVVIDCCIRRNHATVRRTEDVEGRTGRNDCNENEEEANRHHARQDPTEQPINEGEVIPLTSNAPPMDKLGIFIAQLRKKYQNFYEGVQSIPYIRDRWQNVKEIFIDGGISYLDTSTTTARETWVYLKTYKSIFTDGMVKSSRHILEGGPGYGKSTLILQLAYDWCNERESAVGKYNLLIILRLRQLKDHKSIYSAIKRFILPKDSKLIENDIKEILSNNSLSTLVLLDGFDEYPDHESGNKSDVHSIIMNNMLQHCDVILTTRSSCLPKKYQPTTQRIKLTGFDDNARDQYIDKVVVKHDRTDENLRQADKIKQRLAMNPVLKLLCNIPLFFVFFAHLSHEDEQFQEVNSVTIFFRYIINCFHAHMSNKLRDDNVETFDVSATEHRELDKIAFEGLNSKPQQVAWKKEQLIRRLGDKIYRFYVRIGILFEENVLEEPSTSKSPNTRYETMVRFFHMLFCEWYAAHYLAERFSKNESLAGEPTHSHQAALNGGEFKKLYQYLHPSKFHYLCRFACGINEVASEEIIKCLTENKNFDTFVSLCILECDGKIENILSTVEKLLSKEVILSSEETLLTQLATVKLLEIASSNTIPVSSVRLFFCFSSPDSNSDPPCLKENSLSFSPYLQIPRLNVLQELVIEDIADLRDTAGIILEYSSWCNALLSVKFSGVLLPQSFQNKSVLAVLKGRKCKVSWDALSGRWHLNLQVGTWKNDWGDEVTDYDYKKEVLGFKGKVDLNDESEDYE